jgi:pimeloyl-ACP methyl ester carboxylesterase
MRHKVRKAMVWFAACAAGFIRVEGARSEMVTRAVESGGGTLVYSVGGSGSTVLLFIHGWACDRTFWREQLPVFAKKYRVIALDLAGHGDSSLVHRRWTIEALGRDVETVVRAEDLRRAVLIGHSLGGPVALVAARRLKGRVVAVIGVETLHSVEDRIPEEVVQQTTAQLREDFEALLRKLTIPAFHPSGRKLAEWVVQRALKSNHDAVIELIPAVQNFDTASAMLEAGVPVRCINAAEGGPATQHTAVARNRKHGDYAVEFMNGAGHFLMLENPREFNARLGALLHELLSPASDAR